MNLTFVVVFLQLTDNYNCTSNSKNIYTFQMKFYCVIYFKIIITLLKAICLICLPKSLYNDLQKI